MRNIILVCLELIYDHGTYSLFSIFFLGSLAIVRMFWKPFVIISQNNNLLIRHYV